MLKSQPFANAFTTVALGVYVACRVLTLVLPDVVYSIGQSWFHTINMESMRANVSFDVGTFILGGVSLGVFAWVSSYLFVVLYNKYAK